MWVYIWKERLPSAYQQVEYIESSGTQWIDTGVTATQNTKSQIKFMSLEYTWDVIYWMYNWNDNADYRLFNGYNWTPASSNIGACIFDFNSSRIESGTGVLNTNQIFELELGNYYVKDISTWTNIVSWTAISSYTSSRTITLNNYNNSTYPKTRWYYVKIRDWDTLVRDFVPCYRESDWVIWLYDLVNSTFYTNSWSWTFTKWQDINYNYIEHELKNAYIGKYGWEPWDNTMIYLPLNTDLLNHSNKSITVNANSVSIDTSIVAWRWVGNFTSNKYMTGTNIDNMAHNFTISLLMKWTSTSEWFFWQWTATTNRWLHFHFSTERWLYLGFYSNDYDSNIWSGTINDWNRHQVWATYDNTARVMTLYIDWEKIGSKTVNSGFYTWNNNFTIWKAQFSSSDYVNWYLAEIIVENQTWSDSDFHDYFQGIKRQFWIS